MLLHRAFTLVVLLLGVGMGIPLGRLWAEVPEAEAAQKKRVLFANVTRLGEFEGGSKGAGAVQTDTGRYTVTFGRDVGACAAVASAGSTGGGISSNLGIPNVAVGSGSDPGDVRVSFRTPDGTEVNTDFHLIVAC